MTTSLDASGRPRQTFLTAGLGSKDHDHCCGFDC
jgi:hypothetical protein